MATPLAINPAEAVIWEGRPVFRPYLLMQLRWFVHGLGIVALTFLPCLAARLYKPEVDWTKAYDMYLLALGIMICVLLNRMMGWRWARYVITERKIYFRKGGLLFFSKIYDRRKIVHVDVEVSGIEKKNDVETLVFYFGEIGKDEDGNEYKIFRKFECIADAASVLKILP